MTKSNISKQLRQVPPGALHVGVDLALEKNVAVVINEKAERLDQFSFTQDRGGYDYFLRRLEGVRQKHHAPSTVVAMEPSNYFWKLLAKELEEQKIAYHLVNAYTVKKHREGNQLDRSKDDQRDAGQIAELSRNGHYTQTRLQKGAYEELRQYAALYHRLVQGIRCERQVLWGLVGQVFPEYFQVFKDLGGETSWACLESCACAAAMRRITEEELIAEVRAVYTGKKLSVSKIRQAYRWAATSIGVAEGLQAIQLTVRLHLAQLQSLQTQLEQVTSRHARLSCLSPRNPLSTLGKIPGSCFRRPLPGGSGRSQSLPDGRSVGQIGRHPTRRQHFWEEAAQSDPHVPPGPLPIADPALLYLSAHGPVRSPLRSTLCGFTKEAQEPAHQDASPGCPDEQTLAYLMGAHS